LEVEEDRGLEEEICLGLGNITVILQLMYLEV
jgi:hypothetical protein